MILIFILTVMDQARLNFFLKNNKSFKLFNKNFFILFFNNKTNLIGNYDNFDYFYINDFYLNKNIIKPKNHLNKKIKFYLRLKKIINKKRITNIINF